MGLGEAHTALREELAKCQASKDNFKKKAQEYCRTLEELTHIMASKVQREREGGVKEEDHQASTVVHFPSLHNFTIHPSFILHSVPHS